MEKNKRTMGDCPALPPGWKKEEVIRKSGLSAGKCDVYYYSPSGKKFRSKPQLARYLGNSVDLACFDFRTGRIGTAGQLTKQKQRRHERAAAIAKGDLNTSLPIRQTASIFKQPVTKVIGYPDNKVKSDPQRGTESPRQLFWEQRLKGMRSSDIDQEILRTLELPSGIQSMGPDGGDSDTLLAAIASALHMRTAPVLGQRSPAADRNPAVWLNPDQPPCRSFTITEEHIREQEMKVFYARRSLEEALAADTRARLAENA